MNDKTYTAAGFARAEFARHPDGHIAARGAATADFPWLCEDGNFSDDGMVEEGWSPVRECPNPEQHNPAHDIDWQAVAEKHEDTIHALAKERDHFREVAATFRDKFNEADLRAAQPRPLTPDDIDDAAMARAVAAWEETGELRPAIEAALTVPTRPEGAEEIEALIREANREGAGTADKLADRLASRGVRVEGNGR